MDFKTHRKEMIRSKVIELGVTQNNFDAKRLSVIIFRFHPTDEELEYGLLIIKEAVDRYMVKSLEGFTFKTFEDIRTKKDRKYDSPNI